MSSSDVKTVPGSDFKLLKILALHHKTEQVTTMKLVNFQSQNLVVDYISFKFQQLDNVTYIYFIRKEVIYVL